MLAAQKENLYFNDKSDGKELCFNVIFIRCNSNVKFNKRKELGNTDFAINWISSSKRHPKKLQTCLK